MYDRMILRECGSRKLEAVIWDWDGAAADTLPHAFRFWKKICEENGKPFPLLDYDDVRSKVVEPFARFYDEVLGFDFKRDDCWIRPAFKEFMLAADIGLRPGVRDSWEYCASLDIRVGIASSNLSEVIEPHLSRMGVSRELVRDVVGYGNGIRAKPCPDALIACAGRLGVSPDACLYVGDMPGDVVASKDAWMRSVAVAGGFSTPEVLVAARPYFYYESPHGVRFAIDWIRRH